MPCLLVYKKERFMLSPYPLFILFYHFQTMLVPF